jgi:Transposase
LAAALRDSHRRHVIHGRVLVAVFDILEQTEFEVFLVNARDTKNLPGRKSDVQESQWLMKLHTYGLLRNSFRPSQEIRVMRTYWRQRNDLAQSASRHILRIQKALTQMKCAVVSNVKLARQSPAKHGLFDSQLHIFCSVGTAAKTRWLPPLIA